MPSGWQEGRNERGIKLIPRSGDWKWQDLVEFKFPSAMTSLIRLQTRRTHARTLREMELFEVVPVLILALWYLANTGAIQELCAAEQSFVHPMMPHPPPGKLRWESKTLTIFLKIWSSNGSRIGNAVDYLPLCTLTSLCTHRAHFTCPF